MMILKTSPASSSMPMRWTAPQPSYKALLGGEETPRFDYPKMGLRLAQVSSPKLSVLVIAGPPERRKPFEATRLTIKVKALEEAVAAAAGFKMRSSWRRSRKPRSAARCDTGMRTG